MPYAIWRAIYCLSELGGASNQPEIYLRTTSYRSVNTLLFGKEVISVCFEVHEKA